MPTILNNETTLTRHFSKFGKVVKVQNHPGTRSAIVQFAEHKEAKIARLKGKEGFITYIFRFVFANLYTSDDLPYVTLFFVPSHFLFLSFMMIFLFLSFSSFSLSLLIFTIENRQPVYNISKLSLSLSPKVPLLLH